MTDGYEILLYNKEMERESSIGPSGTKYKSSGSESRDINYVEPKSPQNDKVSNEVNASIVNYQKPNEGCTSRTIMTACKVVGADLTEKAYDSLEVLIPLPVINANLAPEQTSRTCLLRKRRWILLVIMIFALMAMIAFVLVSVTESKSECLY